MATNRVETRIAQEVLLSAQNVGKRFGHVPVLDDVSLDLRAGEFIALLGPSGSGKSSLLRILAGLARPSSGDVLVHGRPLRDTNPQVAIVFQSFALYPWLTVRENVELGLLATTLSGGERRERALRVIDLIGLDGFEDAYPKELSGGMKQRVGFARALVVEPEVLFMDEPFSALDVLTADNLRHELLDLWREKKIPTRAILMVTHNIAEAVSTADRLLVFGANPGRIRVDLAGLPVGERQRQGILHERLVDTIYRIMTNPSEEVARLLPGVRAVRRPAVAPTYQALPHVSIGDLAGLLERLETVGGREDLARVAEDLQLEADELLPLAEAADLLGLGDVEQGDLFLTETGQRFVAADVLHRKNVFRQQALDNLDLVREIVRDLDEASDHSIPAERVLRPLEQTFSPEEARRQLDTAIDWGRYAELFAYDDHAGELYLESEEEGAPEG